jgi:hypothetical protein
MELHSESCPVSETGKMAQRISKLAHDGLTGHDLTLSWFTRLIQPLNFHKRLICAYSGVNDPLRVTKDNLLVDSLNKRIRTLVKVTQRQNVHEIVKAMCINRNCPPVSLYCHFNVWTCAFLACYLLKSCTSFPSRFLDEGGF